MSQIDEAIASAERLLEVLRKIKMEPPLPLTVNGTKERIHKLTCWLGYIESNPLYNSTPISKGSN